MYKDITSIIKKIRTEQYMLKITFIYLYMITTVKNNKNYSPEHMSTWHSDTTCVCYLYYC